MNHLFTTQRILLSAGLTTILALCCTRLLALLPPRAASFVVVGDMGLFILFTLIYAGLSRRYSRLRRHERLIGWSWIALFAVPLLWLVGRALWLFIMAALLSRFGIAGRAIIIRIEGVCENTRCWHVATYQLSSAANQAVSSSQLIQSELPPSLIGSIQPGQTFAVHYLPAFPTLAEIDSSITLNSLLWATGILLVCGSPLILLIAACLTSRPSDDTAELPSDAIYDDPYRRYKWSMDALRRR